MNDSMTPAGLLRAAATLVERAATQLNTEHHTCSGCGAPRYVAKLEGRAFERVGDTPNKLRATADMLEGK